MEMTSFLKLELRRSRFSLAAAGASGVGVVVDVPA